MKHRNTIVILAGLSLWLLDGTPAVAQSYGTQAQVDVAKALKDAKVSLQDGLGGQSAARDADLRHVRAGVREAGVVGVHDEG